MSASMAYDGKVSLNGTEMWAGNITGGKRGTILERTGFGGTRSHFTRNTRAGPYGVAGGWTCEPSPAELLVLLAWAIDGTALTVVNDRSADQKSFANTKCNRLTVSGRQGGLITATVEWVGMLEATGSSVTDPTSTAPYAYAPDTTITLASSSRAAASFTLTIDNRIATDRTLNSLSLTEVDPTDQIVTLSVDVPYVAANTALYDQALAGAAGSLSLVQDGYVALLIYFAALQVSAEPPAVQGNEFMLTLNMQARSTNSTTAIAVTGGTAS